MPDADVEITAGSGTKVDTRTVGAGTDEHRQVVVVGDPTTAANVQSVTANGEAVIGGNVAHDGVDAGNPIKIGGVANTSTPALVAAGDRVNAWLGTNGAQGVFMAASNSGNQATLHTVSPGSDTVSSSTTWSVVAVNTLFNGTNWDRQRSVAAIGDGAAATGIAAAGLMGYNGTNWDRVRVANTGRLQVDVVSGGSVAQGGDVAHDAVDSGNPVKIGGKAFSATPANVANGDRVDAWFTTNGTQAVFIPSVFPVVIGDPNSGNNVVVTGTGANNALQIGGNVAHDGVDSGNPVKIGGKALEPVSPTTVAVGDRVDAMFDRQGRQLVLPVSHLGSPLRGVAPSGDGITQANLFGDGNASHAVATASGLMGYNGTTWDRVRVANTGRLQVDVVTDGSIIGIGSLPAADANTGIAAVAQVPHKIGYTIASATARYTTTQTSTTLGPTVSASQRMVVTSIQIQAGGTTAGEVVVYFGTGAYTRGTNLAVFDGEFAPSATSKPGYAQSPSVPYMGAADAELRVTTSAAINPLTVTVWYYIVAV